MRIRWAGHVVGIGEMINAYKVFVGKPEGKKPLGRRSCRWENSITVGREGVDWIHFVQNRD